MRSMKERFPCVLYIVVVVVLVVAGQTIWFIYSQTQPYNWCTSFSCMHGMDSRFQLTLTSGGFSSQCSSMLFLNEFTVLLFTTSYDEHFKLF